MDTKSKLILTAFFLFVFSMMGLLGFKLFGSEPIYKYSSGSRVGKVRKISEKGYIHKTFEGEMMLNADMGTANLDTFEFSVTSKELMDSIMSNSGKQLILNYDQYILVPFSVGSTGYLVTSFEVSD